MRYVPLIGLILLIGVGVVWRSWLQHRRYATWGIFLLRDRRGSQILRDTLLVLFFLIVVSEAVVLAIWPEVVSNRMVIAPRNPIGSLFLFGGLLLMIQAQLHLGASWRIGIDELSKSGLVTHGLYRVSRNPIFSGMLVSLFGLTMLIPTLLSFIALLGTAIAIRWQVLEEESYLRRTYDTEYVPYARSVGRFLPWLGRLR